MNIAKNTFYKKYDNKILAMKDEKGNQKYESVMEWVGNEYARVESMYNTIKSGQELGLKRRDGLDDANILMEVEKYSNRLNGALEAFISGGDITAEEARLIITGDRNTFERVKKLRTSKEGMIETGIKEYDTLISLLDKKSDDVSWMQVFQQSGVSDKQIGEINKIASENNLYGMDSSQLQAARQRYIVERDKLIDSYKYWTGHSYIGTSNVGAEEFGEFSDVGFDDKDGDIRVFRIVDGIKTIVYDKQGTVDYKKGEVTLNLFNPSAYVGSTLDIIIKPDKLDVRPLREQVVLISESNLNITMNDVSSVKSGLTTATDTGATTTTTTTITI